MNQPPPPFAPIEPDGTGFTDSDQQWFNQLSGRLSAAGDPAAAREAEAVRGIFSRADAREAADPDLATQISTPSTQARWNEIQQRLAIRRVEPIAVQRWRSRRTVGYGALAATVLVAAILFGRAGEEPLIYDPRPTYRGALDVTRIRSASPRHDAEAFKASLQALGMQPSIYQNKTLYTVDAEVGDATSPQALDVLRKAGAQSGIGLHRVEFLPQE